MTPEQQLQEAQDNLKKAQEHLEALQKELEAENEFGDMFFREVRNG